MTTPTISRVRTLIHGTDQPVADPNLPQRREQFKAVARALAAWKIKQDVLSFCDEMEKKQQTDETKK